MKASNFQEKQAGLSNPFTLGGGGEKKEEEKEKGITEEVKV